MSELTSQLAAEVVAACQAGAEEASGALSRALDGEFSLAVGEATRLDASSPPEGFGNAGLAIMLKFGDVGLAAVIPESSGLLPNWYVAPDPAGQSKLDTLAQEFSMLLVPETMVADQFSAARVAELYLAITEAGVVEDATCVPLEITSGETTAQLNLIWPLSEPERLLPADQPSEAASPIGDKPGGTQSPSGPLQFSDLPRYSRSILKIAVPLRVVLAEKKESLQDVADLAPGSFIKFEKSCDELLNLYVGEHPIAEGEAVTIGDKFGIRVSAMLMPDEHFMRSIGPSSLS